VCSRSRAPCTLGGDSTEMSTAAALHKNAMLPPIEGRWIPLQTNSSYELVTLIPSCRVLSPKSDKISLSDSLILHRGRNELHQRCSAGSRVDATHLPETIPYRGHRPHRPSRLFRMSGCSLSLITEGRWIDPLASKGRRRLSCRVKNCCGRCLRSRAGSSLWGIHRDEASPNRRRASLPAL
jgi:hypothetical protein